MHQQNCFGVLLEEACKVVDLAKFEVVFLHGFQSLTLASFVNDEAINFVLEELTHVLGRRFVSQDGMYTSGPVSPLILRNQSIPMELDNATKAIYVLDSVKAARLVDAVQNTEIYASQIAKKGPIKGL